MKKIIVNYGLRKKIMVALDCTYPTVQAALEYRSHTDKAKRIRNYALRHGGQLFQKNWTLMYKIFW